MAVFQIVFILIVQDVRNKTVVIEPPRLPFAARAAWATDRTKTGRIAEFFPAIERTNFRPVEPPRP